MTHEQTDQLGADVKSKVCTSTKIKEGLSKTSKPFNVGFIPDDAKRKIVNVSRF